MMPDLAGVFATEDPVSARARAAGARRDSQPQNATDYANEHEKISIGSALIRAIRGACFLIPLEQLVESRGGQKA